MKILMGVFMKNFKEILKGIIMGIRVESIMGFLWEFFGLLCVFLLEFQWEF